MSRPLPVLLSRALGLLVSELPAHEAAPLAVWSNVVRCVAAAGSEGIDERSLAVEARLSRRMAISAVTAAVRRGLVTTAPATKTVRRVMLTEAGAAADQHWRGVLGRADERWRDTPLRAALEELVDACPFELAHFPAGYGTADPSAIGGPSAQRAKKDDGLPAHGADWVPVRRAATDTVSSLFTPALLSQALLAFTVDYEDAFPWPLASTLNVLCHIGDEPRPLAEVPGDHGITGAGKSLLERHLIVRVSPSPDAPRTSLVALTDRGRAVLQHHPARLRAVEDEWRVRYGDALVSRLSDALAPLADGAVSQPDHAMALAEL